eukprot:NODE_1027_length_1997_cov_0.506322.p1 type:complete len:253 gc:universal NODE_1027_length_1997_cov_0.506322:1601-843(-)
MSPKDSASKNLRGSTSSIGDQSGQSLGPLSSFCVFAVDQEKRPCLVVYMHLIPSNSASQDVIDLIMEKVRVICADPYSILLFYQPSEFNAPISLAYSIYNQSTREIKKNVKQVIIVHPPTFIQLILQVIYKIASPKFKRKIRLCCNLTELRAIIPQFVVFEDPIKVYNATVDPSFQSQGVLYKKELIDLIRFNGAKMDTPASELLLLCPDPLNQLFSYLLDNGVTIKGIFRKSPHTKLVQKVQAYLDQGFFY